MRVIKFRAWDKDKKEMCIVSSLEFLFESINGICANVPNDDHSPDAPLFRDIFPEALELMQFTGKHDGNGREIYEGDIVLHKADINKEDIYTVEWFNAGFMLSPSRIHPPAWNRVEVIGNVWENPDLLK